MGLRTRDLELKKLIKAWDLEVCVRGCRVGPNPKRWALNPT